MTHPSRSTGSKLDRESKVGLPRWLVISVMAVLALALVVIIAMMALGGTGGHGPSRHGGGADDTPTSGITGGHVAPEGAHD